MESSSSQSFNSSQQQHYSALLTTVAELRTDLEKTVNKIHVLEQVNHELSDDYSAVKDELIETRKKYNEAQENYQKSASSKLETDRHNSLFLEKMKQQLTEKTKEFEVLRDKFIPQDIDYIRMKVQEEFEIPHEQRRKALEMEIEKQKDLYYSMRREAERYKADYEFFSQSQQREVNAIRSEHETEVSALRDHITRLQAKESSGEKEEKIRSLQLKEQELQRGVDIFKQERDALARDRDDLKLSFEHARSLHEQKLAQLKSHIAVIEADKTTMDQKINNLQTDNDAKDVQIRALRQQCEDTISQLDHKTAAIQDREVFFNAARDSHADELERLRNKFEEELRVKEEDIELLTHKLGDREEMMRKTHKESTEMQLRAETMEGELRRTHLAKLQEIKQKNDALEMENANIKRDFQMTLLQRSEMQDKFGREAGLLRSEISRIKREKEIILSRSTMVEQALDAERRKVSSSKRLSAARTAMSNDLVAEMKTKITDLEHKLQDAREKEIKASADLRATEELLSHKEKEFSMNLETMQRQAHSKYEELGKEFKDQLDQMKVQAQRAIIKERKRSETYKEKALEAHQRGKLLSAVVAAGGGPAGSGRADE